MLLFLSLFLSVILLSGCAAPASRWRDDAFKRFNSAVSEGSQQSAPDETENIRQTLALADRYFYKELCDDADRLYQLSSQKSQLLLRNLVLSKVEHKLLPLVQNQAMRLSEKTVTAADPVIISEQVAGSTNALSAALPDSGQQINHQITSALPDRSSKKAYPPEAAHKTAKKISRRHTVAKRFEPDLTTIYLTFDDGPSRLTLPIAAYLNSQGIAATFFALGNNVKGHEKVVSETVALGHNVGNHTLSHDLRKLNDSLGNGVNEIEKTAAMIDKLGGDGKMVRIPYGASSKTLAAKVASEGGQIFYWDVNSLDSTSRGAKDHVFIERAVMQQLQESGKRHIIMLFHDGAGHAATYAAIRNLVPRLKQEGYRFGLLSRSDRVAHSGLERNPTP